MKNLTILAAFSVFLAGCQSGGTSSGPDKATKEVNSSANSSSKEQNVAAVPDVNSEPPAGSNSNTAGSFEDMKARKMQAMRGPMAEQPGIASPGQPFTRPAPDNSIYTVTLGEDAVETRTFRDNPQLVKVEKHSNGSKSSVKVYLKDGRVIDLPGEKIAAMSMASAADILAAAGVTHGSTGASKK